MSSVIPAWSSSASTWAERGVNSVALPDHGVPLKPVGGKEAQRMARLLRAPRTPDTTPCHSRLVLLG